MKKNKRKIKFKSKQLNIILLLIICVLSAVFVLARYIFNEDGRFFTKSKEFYFTSDKLKENNPFYQINNWSGADNYVILINMNSRKNNLLNTSYDINYTISYTCSNNIICQLSKNAGTISYLTNTDSFNLTIIPNTLFREGDSAFVEITATTNSIYDKQIKARFSLVVGRENLSYEIVDSVNNPYIELKITNTLTYYKIGTAFGTYSVGDEISEDTYLSLSEQNKERCYSTIVTLNFNSNNVLLDMTNYNYLNATNVSTTQRNGYDYIERNLI